MTEKVNLAQKLGLFDEPWQPKIVARINDSDVRVVKVKASSSGTSTRTPTTSSSSFKDT